MKHQLLIYSLSSVLVCPAQFQNTYNSVTGAYTVMGAQSGAPIYQFRDTNSFTMYVDTVRLNAPVGIAKVVSGGILTSGTVDYNTDVANKPTLATIATSGSYTDLSNKPTIPAQYNPTQGTGISITGSYPNQTITNTSLHAAYDKSALLSNNGVLIIDTFTISTATPTVSFATILSTVGKSNFKIAGATGYRASATATTSPNVSVTALTSNSATFILTQQNTATVTILGINVLNGLPMVVVPDPANVKLVLSLIAY